jgi:hypothetical protein
MLAYCLSLALLSTAGFPADMQDGRTFPYLADKPVGEDGYYMLTVAWNIASGDGVSYNQGMPAVGIQPLSTAIYAGVAWIVQSAGGDKWDLIRAVLIFGGLNLLLFGHVVGRITTVLLEDPDSADLGYVLGFVIAVFNFALFRWFTYGLETGIYLTLLALSVLYTLRILAASVGLKEVLKLGVLTGLTAWARIDFGVIYFVFLGLSLLRRQLRFGQVLLAGSTTALVVSPWFLYVYSVTGKWMPSSGTAQAALLTTQEAPQRFGLMGQAVLSHLTPWIYSRTGGVFSLLALLSLVALLIWIFSENSAGSRLMQAIRRYPFLLNWIAGPCSLLLIYPVFFWAAHFYQRYSAPLLVPLIPIMAMMLTDRIKRLPDAMRVAAPYAMPVCFFVWSLLSLHTGRIGNSHTVTARYIQEHFSSASVGVFQSGVIGYFNPNVVNLDGKLNQFALEYASRDELHLYLESEAIGVLVDWPSYLHRSLDEEWLASNWVSCEERVPSGQTICLERRSR